MFEQKGRSQQHLLKTVEQAGFIQTTPVVGAGLCARLDAAIKAATAVAHDLEMSLRQGALDEEAAQMWDEYAERVQLDFEADADEARAAARQENAVNWESWLEQVLQGSARVMHRWSKLSEAWTPTTVTAGGITTAAPQAILDEEVACLRGLWKAQAFLEEAEVPDRHCFPRASCKLIRAASQKFPPHTAQTLDGFHPRHIGMLCDDGLETLVCLYEGWSA